VVGSAPYFADVMTNRESTSAPARGGSGAAPAQAGPGTDEFAHVRSPRVRHPVLAGAAALLAFSLVFHLRAELRFALSAAEPLDAGDARVTFSPRTTVTGLDDRYVRVRGTPDRESGLEVDTKGSWTFSQFFRVLGTGNHLFVHRRESPLPGWKAEADVFEGRLVRFAELPFEDAVRAYFSAHVAASHFFAPGDLRAALAAAAPGGPLALRDRAGDPVQVAPDDLLFVDVVRPEEVRLGLPRERFADAGAARAEIERRGGTIVADKGLVKVDAPGAAAGAAAALALSTPPPPFERWTFIARFSADAREAALNALGELDRKVEIRDARETLKVRRSDLGATDDGFSMRPGGGSERREPLPAIAAVRTLATAQVPPDAYLLIEADRPRDHLPTLLLALAVATFGVFNLAALARELRR
jgi:hypothetical protein